MTIRGTVRKGKVELEPGATLPDGTKVDISPIAPATASVYRLFELALPSTEDDGLPPDFASETDHYTYGTPRRKPAAKAPKRRSKARPKTTRKKSAASPAPRSGSRPKKARKRSR